MKTFLLVLILALGALSNDASPSQRSHRIPSNTNDPDYFNPSGVGGHPQTSGGDGSVVIITKQPTELRSTFFYTGEKATYVVPGSTNSSPYHQVVQIKLWGGGGGGCDGGRLNDDSDVLSSGSAGGYVEAHFDLPMGETLIVDVGGGGRSRSDRSETLLGGLGGYNGGKAGYRDRSSGGGGGGGMSTISFGNGTILAAAFGGDGGGNSTYCTALGGLGGRLRGMTNDGFVNTQLALVDYTKDDTIESDINGSGLLALPENIASSPMPMPQNEWIPMTVTHDVAVAEANTKMTNATWCEHSNHRPAGRRGHSMTVVNNHVYIFGGALLKCVCTVINDEKQCSSKNVYSSELWHLDVSSSVFTLLQPSGEDEWPSGREQHSATALPNGDILITGGLSSSDGIRGSLDEPLNEVWKLSDPHRVTSHIIRGGEESSITKLPMELNQSYLSSHTLNVDLGDDVCLEDLQLSVSFEHGCPQGIEFISLTGPTSPSDKDSAQSRYYQTKVSCTAFVSCIASLLNYIVCNSPWMDTILQLFVSTVENRERDCDSSQFNLLFADNAEEAVLSYSALPKEGAYRPASSLQESFQGLPVDGEWKLTISTSKSLVNYTESLLDWKLHIQAKSCTPRVKWERISVPPSFQPRHGHTAVAVGDSIFISGGFDQHRLNDLWRFDHSSNTWTNLNTTPLGNHPAIQRQAAVLGPWGLLNYGGVKQGSKTRSNKGGDMSIQHLFKDERLAVPLFGNTPQGRYLTSLAMIESSDVNVINKLYENDGPFLLMFGGDGGNPNAYPNSYGFMPNSFFDDVWILSPSELNGMNTIVRSDYCVGRLDRASQHSQIWNSTCGWETSVGSTPEECELGEILIMAWCKQQYQSFHVY